MTVLEQKIHNNIKAMAKYFTHSSISYDEYIKLSQETKELQALNANVPVKELYNED